MGALLKCNHTKVHAQNCWFNDNEMRDMDEAATMSNVVFAGKW